MARKDNGKKVVQPTYGKGTGQARYGHGDVVASLTALNRAPLAIPAQAKPKDDKSEFLLGLLKEAGSRGVTWSELQAQLKAKYGMAPKKRHSLYLALKGQVWHKATEAKGIVRYFLGKAPKVRSRKQA